jgi:hypothetical protein
MIQPKRLVIAILALSAAVGAEAYSRPLPPGAAQGASDFTRWTFREDFSHGIPGWVSFPLSQDVGYDPTIYTTQVGGSPLLVRDMTSYGQRLLRPGLARPLMFPALVRDMTSYGERLLRVGLARPLMFHVAPSSSFRIVYDFETFGRNIGLHLTLGAVDGRRYNHSLSFQPGAHDVQVDGRQLEMPAAGVDVDVIVLEAEVDAPPPGSHSRLTLRALEIQAERPASILIRAPKLDRSPVNDIAVAQEVVAVGNPLKVDLGAGSAARVAVYDDVGGVVRTADIPAGGARDTQFDPPDKPGLYMAEITSHPAGSEFYFLALGKVPLHPRVLLTPERLEQLRSQSYSNQLLAIVHRRASELRNSLAYNPQAGQNILLLPTFIIHPGIPEYFALMGAYSNAIAFNALDFRINGDRQALEAARRALLTVSAWPTWTPAWFNAKGIHTYYEVGVFTQKVALGYDLIADELSPEEKSTIAEALWKLSIQPTLDDYFYYDRLPVHASNHEPQSVGGAIEACVALYGDVPDWPTRFGPALAELIEAYERLLDGLFPGDGSEAEPAGYEHFAMEGMSWGMAALHALDIRPRGFEKMMKAFWWLRYAQIRPDLLLDTGDFGSELGALSGYAWGAEYAGDPALRAFYETATGASLRGVFGLRPSGRTVEQPPGLLDLVCCTHPSEVTPEPPLSRIFPGRGSAVMRSGWQPQDTVISLRVGPWFNHEHHDQGSFRVAAYGEELVAEGGYAEYYKDPHYPDYFTQAPAHNTVVVDDDPFSQQDYDGRFWPAFQNFARFERHVFSPGIDYLTANLAPAYGDASQIQRLTREYIFVKPDILIVHDHVEAALPHDYSWFLHIPPGAQTDTGAVHALIRGKAAFATLTAAGENTHWRLQPQPVPTNAYSDFDRIPVEPREAFRLDSPRGKEGDFLVALHFQKASEEAAPLLPLRTTLGDGFRVRNASGSTIVLFRRNAGPLMAGGFSADSSSLVVSERDGVEEIFAAEVHSLRRGQQSFLSANPAAEVVLDENPSFAELHVMCTGETDLRILPKKQPVDVIVDQVRATPTFAEGFISLAHLAKGEHVVRISY